MNIVGARMRTELSENEPIYDWRRDGWLAACAFTAILLIVSAGIPHAPGFDTFLRLFVFCLALVRGFVGFRSGGAWLPLSAAVIALLFNPARPVQMSVSAWVWTDLAAAAWFAIVGAWRLLRSWEPQRGWAAAALSLVAVAIPAVAAFGTVDREGLNPATLDENLAAMNTNANATQPVSTPPAHEVAVSDNGAPESEPRKQRSPNAEGSSPARSAEASANLPELNAPAFPSANRVTANQDGQDSLPPAAPATDAPPADNATAGDEQNGGR